MRRALLLGSLALIVAALVIVPLPFVVLSPGLALSVPDRVELAHEEDDVSGDLLLTTVRFSDASAVGALLGWLDDDREVVRRRSVYPSGVDVDEFLRVQASLFDESARTAAAVGLRAAGFDVQIGGEGAQVITVLPGSDAEGKLQAGDVITAVEGDPIRIVSDLSSALAPFDAGDRVRLTVRRAGAQDREEQVEVRLLRLESIGRPGIGVAITTVGLQIELPFEVDVSRGSVVGPSGGLLLALSVYELAEPSDLTRGRVIAGTGTIDLDGRVGPVGGVVQKVEAAKDAGAEVFLVPPEEEAEARDAAGDDLEVVMVRTIDDAITALSR